MNPQTRQAAKGERMTPYQVHQTLNHHMSRHSPNGYDIIEECDDCGQRWQHNPSIGYPVTLATREVFDQRLKQQAQRMVVNTDIGRGYND